MNALTAEVFLSTVALVGAVIIVAALLSGTVERTGLPQVAVFLALGAVLGPAGLGLLEVDVQAPILRVLATLSLVLVLFTDAVSLSLREIREHKLLTMLVVGPGTFINALLVTAAATWLLGLPVAMAAMLGAAVSSTDPVLLRGLLRRPGLDSSVRQVLRLESGLNDIVLLPIVLVAIELVQAGRPLATGEWGRLAVSMFVLSPAAGAAVGLLAVSALGLVRRQIGVRRDYESIYSLGVAFLAFAAAEGVHGSGFLAAFFAGLTIAALDVELCDCFLEYGETTAEMALLFTFVLFGTALIWTGLTVANGATLLFTALVLLLRPLALIPALAAVPLSWRNRGLIAWFGPRGLSSLLLVLLPVFAGVSGSDRLLTICCLVVLCSVVLHGLSPILLLPHTPAHRRPGQSRQSAPRSEQTQSAEAEGAGDRASIERAEPAGSRAGSDSAYITIDELRALEREGQSPVIVDARTERTYWDSSEIVPGAVRMNPDRVVADAERLGLPRGAPMAVFCA